MPDTTRLVNKLDEAIEGLRKHRRRGDVHGSNLAQALRERFVLGRPFEVTIGGIRETVRCDKVRVSKTTVFLPTERAGGTIPLTRVTMCSHGNDKDGAEITGFGVIEDNGNITTFAIA